MEQAEVRHRESSIVLVGTFDPLAMTPHWFVKQGMIPQEDIDENLAIELVYKELTKFSLANVFVEIQEGMIVLRSDHPSFDYKIHDLALGILSSVKKSEVTALGINLYTDVFFEDADFWHKVGHRLAPKDIWLQAAPDSERVGMANLQMQINKPAGEPGVYNFTVGWLDKPKAIRFSLNNHFDSKHHSGYVASTSMYKKAGSPVFDPIAIISAYWQQTLDFQSHVVNSLLAQVRQEQ